MQEGDFTLNNIGYYTPKIVEENSWLNDKQKPEDLAKFGKNYAVVFEGDAQTYLWTAKNEPEVGKRYWGHLQATSGKSIRFKTDKQEDAPTNGSSPQNQPQGSYEAHSDKEDSIARAVALKAAVEYAVGFKLDDVLTIAELYFSWLKNDSGTSSAAASTLPVATSNEVQPAPAAVSGYAKAQQARQNLDQDPEVQSLMDFAEQHNGEYDDN